MWFFARTRWMNRIIARTKIDPRSREARLLVELVTWAAKQHERTAYLAASKRLPKAIGVLGAAAAMYQNPSAVEQIAKRLAISEEDAFQILVVLRGGALHAALDFGFQRFAEAEMTAPA